LGSTSTPCRTYDWLGSKSNLEIPSRVMLASGIARWRLLVFKLRKEPTRESLHLFHNSGSLVRYRMAWLATFVIVKSRQSD
jgi:hypothetical protein